LAELILELDMSQLPASQGALQVLLAWFDPAYGCVVGPYAEGARVRPNCKCGPEQEVIQWLAEIILEMNMDDLPEDLELLQAVMRWFDQDSDIWDGSVEQVEVVTRACHAQVFGVGLSKATQNAHLPEDIDMPKKQARGRRKGRVRNSWSRM
jgi:hypothetical protein